jgi:hypothetical protein
MWDRYDAFHVNIHLEPPVSAIAPSSAHLNLPGSEDACSARGGLTRGEYIHGRKLPQIAWIIDKLSETESAFHQQNVSKAEESVHAFLHILDVGGGRGDLACMLAANFPWLFVTVVDINEDSLLAGQAFARNYEKCNILPRMRFVCSPFSVQFNASSAWESLKPPPIDLVVGLHACGGLTDLAISYAMQNQCRLLVVPCCYSRLIRQPNPKLEEYLGVACSDCSHSSSSSNNVISLLRLAESDNRILGCRACRIINLIRMRIENENGADIRASYFPVSFSQRNIVLSSGIQIQI